MTPCNVPATKPIDSNFQLSILLLSSLRKQLTFGNATTGFPTKWRLRNECKNPILMTRHYPDLANASDWSCRVGNLIQPIRSTTQIWLVTCHQYGISALVSQTSFGMKISGSDTKCRLFSQATYCRKWCQNVQNSRVATVEWFQCDIFYI